jgi:Tfp pilus assembly protein PilN
MIQFNLLPDVKLEYVKANRLKHSITVIAVLAASIALFIMIMLIVTIDVVQKAHMNSLNSQITSITSDLKNIPNLNQVLTVQSQVNALPALHAQKPVTTRLATFISDLTPSKATISQLNINFQTNVITITGSADSLATVNQFVDTLKLSSYQSSGSTTSKNAFSNVVLTSFGYTSQNGATYSITATFDPVIFSGSSNSVTLNVPSSNATHSNSSTSGNGTLFQSQGSTSN